MSDSLHGMAWGSFSGDALAMPVHWYYDRAALHRDYGIVRDYGGHGVGREMHEPPHILNFGKPGTGLKLKRGMVVALEPMFALGGPATEELSDRWSVRMVDGSCSAHFEETIAITDGEPEVLTRIG